MATIRWDRVRKMRDIIETEEGQMALIEGHLGGPEPLSDRFCEDVGIGGGRVVREGSRERAHPVPLCSEHRIPLQVDPYTGEQVCTECSPRYWA